MNDSYYISIRSFGKRLKCFRVYVVSECQTIVHIGFDIVCAKIITVIIN